MFENLGADHKIIRITFNRNLSQVANIINLAISFVYFTKISGLVTGMAKESTIKAFPCASIQHHCARWNGACTALEKSFQPFSRGVIPK